MLDVIARACLSRIPKVSWQDEDSPAESKFKKLIAHSKTALDRVNVSIQKQFKKLSRHGA